MREALRQLRPVDTFNIYSFSGSTGSAFAAPQPANTANIQQGTEYVTSLQAAGGTYMADAIKAALGTDVERGRTRYVFFMTDGYVGNEAQIIADAAAFVKKHKSDGHKARVFGFGVGSSVNRYLLDGLGKEGDGLTVYATTREDPVTAVNKFYHYIDRPVIEDMKIDWNGLQATEVYPSKTPDLFASHPMTLHARIDGAAGDKTIIIRGKYDGKTIELPVKVHVNAEKIEKAPLATLWARSKIGDLERDLWNGENATTVDAITTLGLGYRLVTRYTSFVAVDKSTKVDGKSQTIVQPVEAPEGVDPNMAGPGQVMASKGSASVHYGMMKEKKEASRSYQQGLGLSGIGAGGGGLVSGESSGYGYGSASGKLGSRRSYAAPATAAPPPPAEQPKAESLDAPAKTREPAKDKGKSETEDNKPADRKAPLINGAIDQSAVLAMLLSHDAEVKKCFEAAGKKGTITLRWFVTTEGVVLQIKVLSSTVKDAALEQCLTQKVKAWTFPKAASGTVEITYTFKSL
jgi:Ca-activated chloride channel family protein